ncbi:MAG TPA: hypothetical protein V6D20_22765, partial [Candidatus Obscuribacterales bacterium]
MTILIGFTIPAIYAQSCEALFPEALPITGNLQLNAANPFVARSASDVPSTVPSGGCGSAGDSAITFRWTALPGVLTWSTGQSTFDARLALYSNVNGVCTLVACNDDGGVGLEASLSY